LVKSIVKVVRDAACIGIYPKDTSDMLARDIVWLLDKG
jgi:hypothetical protein